MSSETKNYVLHFAAMFAIAAVIVLALTLVFPMAINAKSANPAWVQMIGTFIGLGIAIWVPNRNHKLTIAREQDKSEKEITNMLQSFEDEIKAISNGYGDQVRDALRGTSKGVVGTRFGIPKNPFPVYTTHVGRIGQIPNAKLRALIISTYAKCDVFLLSLGLNNDYLQEYKSAKHQLDINPTAAHRIEFDNASATLATFGDELRRRFEECEKSINECLPALENAIRDRRKDSH